MNRFRKITFGLLSGLICLAFAGCTPDDKGRTGSGPSGITGSTEGETVETAPAGCREVVAHEVFTYGLVTVEVHVPKSDYQGDLLVLHAWDDSWDTWCRKGRLCARALRKGYRVILPDMGKSIYTKQYYPETRPDWAQDPTAAWLADTLIPTLQSEHCLLKADGQNFVLGVSAGARGAIRLLSAWPEMFAGAAALSGDYDPSMMKGDNIYRGFLGSYDDHPERWTTAENLTASVDRIRAPLYLGHGRQDDIIPYAQTENLYNVLRTGRPDLKVKLNIAPSRGHGYVYWNFEISNVFRFFEGIKAGMPESS